MQLCFRVEKRRLMLARALYKMPLLLYWTEPTAHSIPLLKQTFYQKYDRNDKGKILSFISPSAPSTRFCSRILMLEQGEIQEEGTHEELLRQSGKYAALYEVQSKYYREGDGKMKTNGKTYR